MKIRECKEFKVLPKKGTPVTTKRNRDTDLPSFKTMHPFIMNRIDGRGKYMDFVAGSSGDYWWITHEDGSIAIYSTEEVFD